MDEKTKQFKTFKVKQPKNQHQNQNKETIVNRFHYFIGVDVSKLKLNGSLLMQGRIIKSFEVTNDLKGFKEIARFIKKIPGYIANRLVVCMESTSIYHIPLANYLSNHQIAIVWVENATQIKRSMGIRRGQNDLSDARNITAYAYRHQDKLEQPHRIYQAPSMTFLKLKFIQRHRDKLLKIKLQLKNEVNEYKAMKTPEMRQIADLKEALNKDILAATEASIAQCEAQLKALIEEDQDLKERFDLLQTVEGVGLLVGVYLIVATGNFKTFNNARKFACQIGIAPFQKTSGSSIQVQKGVSHFADKIGKKMITNATGCAIRRYGGLRSYYERKIAEGKKEGIVLNACKNKLLHRIFAVVRSGKPYDRFHQWQLKPNNSTAPKY